MTPSGIEPAAFRFVAKRLNHCATSRCTNVSNLFHFGMTFYMFRTVFPSIIRSSRLYIQQQAYVKQILLSACWQVDSSICCCMYSLELLMMGGKTVRNM